MRKNLKLILIILIIGAVYRLSLTSNGNFLFNMDNARDMVDVREMVETSKLRLIGPTSAIEGFYNGPAWYYLLAIPYILSGGDPYASILMEIALWALGGFFLIFLVKDFGKLAAVSAGSLWILSNYVVLTTSYAFNPNPILFLTPLFIFFLKKYLETEKLVFSLGIFLLAGLFFNFEMNFGVFIPLVLIFSVFLSGKRNIFKSKNFWLGVFIYLLTLMPQVAFDIKHNFIMSKSVIKYLSAGSPDQIINPIKRLPLISEKFFNVTVPTFMNHQFFTKLLTYIFFMSLYLFIKRGHWNKNLTVLITLLYILIPFLGYVLLPTTVNPWHLGGVVAAIILLFNLQFLGRLPTLILSIFVIYFALININNYFKERSIPSNDPSVYKNEVAAIDYVYKKAEGKNFSVYTYLPSVYDYPYQYLFWWYGKKTYGYIPGEYVYSPNKPQYIPSQDKFQGSKKNYSGLVFLIKEPDRIKMRQAWENDYKDMEFISKEMIGPIEVEIRKEKM
ncbi:MAG: glycosyltransferase family 39 protein [Patescibacteria group bacterium]